MTITDEQAFALGRRASAWKHWRLARGVVLLYPDRRVHDVRSVVVKDASDCLNGERMVCVETGITSFKWDPCDGWLPDMRESGTQGWALTLIAEHNHRRSMWDALADVHNRMGRGLSYPEALVEAMEACSRIGAPVSSPRECPACRARGSKRGLAMWEWMIADGMDKYLPARGLGWKAAPQTSPLVWPMMRPCRVCSVDGVPTGVEP